MISAAPVVSLQGRTVVVTGAGQGIGKAITQLVIGLGGNAVALDLNGDTLMASLQALPQDRVMAVVGSVVDAGLATQSVADAVARFGAVHGLVNNAGITRPAMIEKMTARQWQDVIDVHLTGTFFWMQAVGRHMVERVKAERANGTTAADGVTGTNGADAGKGGGGAIVNISSDAGRKGAIGQINYAAAKAGMLGMTMTAAREWGKHGIRTNSVCFGVVETPMTEVVRGDKFRDGMLAQIPMGRWSTPDEVVKTVCFLLSDGASYITGQHLAVNGGFHISL